MAQVPSRSFKYPTPPDIVVLPVLKVLTLVEPRTTTGCQYSLKQTENKQTENKTATIKLRAIL